MIIRISARAPPGRDFQCLTMSVKDLEVHCKIHTHTLIHAHTHKILDLTPALYLSHTGPQTLSFSVPTIKTISKTLTHHIHLQPPNAHTHTVTASTHVHTHTHHTPQLQPPLHPSSSPLGSAQLKVTVGCWCWWCGAEPSLPINLLLIRMLNRLLKEMLAA